MKILIADGEPVSRALARAALTDSGCEIASVGDGDAAWSAIQQRKRPMLVILERQMPGIDGLDLCRRTQSLPAYPPVYIVMVTSAGALADLEAGLGAGADDFIPKPFNVAELRARANVGLRMLALQESLARRVTELEAALVTGSLDFGSLDPKLLNNPLAAVEGDPPSIGMIANIAQIMDSDQLRRLLAGHLYTLKGASADTELIAAAKPVIISANEAMIEALKKRPADIFTLTPREYEELVAELLNDMGYDVTLTSATRDGGKDILASFKTDCGDFLCLVEAKHYRHDRKIGVSSVRELYGMLCDYQANSGMLVTTSSYSRDARAFQQKHRYQLSLSDYTDVALWIERTERRGSGRS